MWFVVVEGIFFVFGDGIFDVGGFDVFFSMDWFDEVY